MDDQKKPLATLQQLLDKPFLAPLIAGIISPLSFASINLDQLIVQHQQLYLFLLLSLSLSLLTFAICTLIFKNRAKAAIFSVVCLLSFFSYGHLKKILPGYELAFSTKILPANAPHTPAKEFTVIIGKDKILYPLFFLGLFFCALKLQKKSNSFAPSMNTLSTLLLITLAMPLLRLAVALPALATDSGNQSVPNLLLDSSANAYPDVYYLIPDSYPRGDVLKHILGFDNSPFLSFLENQGFYVSKESRSNYAHTHFSLASTLNLKHVDYLAQEIGVDAKEISIPLTMISQNEVASIFKSHGYTVINLASGWGPTDQIESADINYAQDSGIEFYKISLPLNEFTLTYLQTTALSPLVEAKFKHNQRIRINNTFKYLQSPPQTLGPKFILAHFVVPHPPYLFKADGSPQDSTLAFSGDEYQDVDKYLDQLRYVNQKLSQTILTIQQTNPTAIILLQSDHGSPTLLGDPALWSKNAIENPMAIYERHAILSAYYFPDQDYTLLKEPLTPVNTFRIIFNKYFQADFDLLENTSFFSDYNRYFEFADVTDMVNKDINTLFP